jgi:proteasome lid subunit RPN8/RPN11
VPAVVRLKVNKGEALAKVVPSSPLSRGRGRSAARSRMAFGQSAHAIRREVLDTIIGAAREAMPHEFAATLRARDGVIYELVLVPGTLSGETSALLSFWNLPPDPEIVGSVHSHPSGNYNPSDADLQLFDKHGTTHIIIAFPFTPGTWRGYDGAGNRRRLEIVE